MTPKEKAKKLIETFGKEYASKVVKEIIASNPHSNPLNTELYSSMDYWFDVKQEILKDMDIESKQKGYSEEDLRKAFAIGMDYYAEPNVWDEVTPKQKFENLLNKSE